MQATAIVQEPGKVIIQPGVSTPQAVYRAFNEQRQVIANQLENLEDKRRELTNEISQSTGASKSGLELRIAELDKRISEVDKQLAQADLDVAKAAGVPNAIPPEPPRPPREGPPEEAFVLGGIFIVVVLLPISIAFARRIWKRSTQAIVAFPQELADRLNRLDQSMDSIAIEVERIGEGQRFVTRVMSDNGNRALGSGAAQPIDVGARDQARVPRAGEMGEL